ncbi:MAG: Ig-like domain-containing protein [Alphaproteobacteria bacterium]
MSYGGSASGGGNGEGDITIMYTPDAGFTGQDTFEYVIYDNMGGTDTGLITISVGGTAPPNSTPIASDDGAVTQEDTAVVIDVLANDTDADGDVLSVTQLGAALNGSVVLYGGDGNDYLDVSSGNNILYGGNGDDKLIAGSGVDTFVFRQGGYRSGYDLLHECEWWGPSGYI